MPLAAQQGSALVRLYSISESFIWRTKVLDNVLIWSIIIFTERTIGSGADEGKRSQTRSPAAAGGSQPAASPGHRRTVRQEQLFRSQRSGPGQVRDATPGAGRRPVDYRRCGRFWFFATILLSGPVGIRTGWSRRPSPAQAWPQTSTQAYRRSFEFHPRSTSEGPLGSTWGTSAIDSPTLWHEGASTKYRARAVAASKKTPLSEFNRGPAVQQDLVAHYEQLRREVTEVSVRRRQGLGLALFLSRGMMAWMQAWSECISFAPSQAPAPATMTVPIPVDLRAQVATLLAGIILGLQQEATP